MCNTSWLVSVMIAAVVAACGDDPATTPDAPTVDASSDAPTPDAPADTLVVQGTVTGANVPTSGKVILLWMVSSGDDYLYKYGEGVASAGTFTLALAAAPPPDALNSYGQGVAFAVLVDASATVPDGRVTEAQLPAMRGISTRGAVLWKNDGASGLAWSASFPAGYACGACVDAPPGETFDSFAPSSCTAIEIVAPDEPAVCNWT